MNKKGFTLIELLTVVVILALLALISVPKIVNVVEKARRESAKSSAIGYVRSIETKVATSGLSYENKDDYAYDEIKLNAKGEFPTGGLYSLYEGKVTNATFCILGYIIEYNGSSDAKIGEKCTGEELKLNSVLKTDRSAIKLTYPKKGYVEIIENLSNGQVTCETSDPKVATCDISNKTLILKPGTKEGYATITLTSEATSKYKEAKTAVVAYTEEGLLSITANGYTGVYDGLFHGISVTSPGATIKYGLEQGTYDLDKSPTYSEVGEYTVYYEATNIGYKPARGSKTISITKAEGSVTAPTAKTLTYNGTAQELINAGSSTTGTVQYKLNNGSYSTNIPTATNAGTYTVYYKVVGDNNHNDVEEKSINVTIAKANNTLTLSSNTGSITYPTAGSFTVTKNTSGGALSCKSSNTNAATCSVSGTKVTVTPGTTAASGVTITVTSAETSNYKASSSAYTLTNNLGTLSVTANGWSGNYDGKAHGISVTSSGATIRYGTTSGTYNLTSSPTRTALGTTTVYYQVTKAGYKTVTGSKNITISDTQAPSTPTVKYNSGRSVHAWLNNINISLSSNDNVGVHHYEVDWTGDGNSNGTVNANFIPWNGYSSCNNRFRAVDAAGNKSAWSGAVDIHMDTQAPAIDIKDVGKYLYAYFVSPAVTDNIGVASVSGKVRPYSAYGTVAFESGWFAEEYVASYGHYHGYVHWGTTDYVINRMEVWVTATDHAGNTTTVYGDYRGANMNGGYLLHKCSNH